MKKERIGILCASDTELDPFLPWIDEKSETQAAMLTFHQGRIEGIEMVAVYSGVCKVNAAVAVQLLIDRFHVSGVINAGTAGGVDERVELFDTVIARECAYHDVEEEILTEFHPWLPSPYFPADKILFAAAEAFCKKSGMPVHFGRIVTGEEFIEGERREEIKRTMAPLAVDMETAAAAHVCYVNQIPFLAVRTITDTASHSGGENFEKNCEKASLIAAQTVKGILRELG